MVAPDRVLSIGQIELNCVHILNWIAKNRTVLAFISLLTKTILILNWIVWNLIRLYMTRKGWCTVKQNNLQTKSNQLRHWLVDEVRQLPQPTGIFSTGSARSAIIIVVGNRHCVKGAMNQGAMAMKGYSTFPKALALLERHHQIV